MPKQIIVLTSESPPVFSAAIAMDYLDPDGKVYLTEPIEFVEKGKLDVVDSSLCYEFDEFLLIECNRMVAQAMDIIAMATHLVKLRAKPAFSERDWINDIDQKTH